MKLSALIPIVALCLGLTTTACFDNGDCVSEDELCACEGAGLCTWDCPDGRCSYEAGGAGAASFSCDGGDCDLLASGTGAVDYDCLGGGCYAEVTGQGSLDLSCAGGACTVDCNGTGACTITDCDDCECNASLTGICG